MSFRFARQLTAGLSMLALALAGCAQEREPINRVQADALAKSFFVGEVGNHDDDPEFYWRNFVVDASESQSLVGIGSWSGVDRIRWEITEHLLLARRSYQQNPGADDKGDRNGPPDGTLVAAYPIESHFDIRREYNPSTGEELNIVSENTTDRPWYERQYMRVDWSINVVDTPQWYDMFAGKVFGNIKVTPLAYYVNDRAHPDAPHFEPEEGYFDVTSKFWVEPEAMIDGSGMEVPACWLISLYTGSAVDNCDPQEAIIRSSYWKVGHVDPDADFEPFDNSRASLDIIGNPGGLADAGSVGIVTPPRIEWDPQYFYTDAGLTRFMHHHNIWKQSHQTKGTCSSNRDCDGGQCLPSGTCSVSCNYNGRRDEDMNGTDDQCENADTGYDGSQGSQCSVINRCTIPYRDREIQPVGFWMNKETPDELTDQLDDDGNVVARGANEDLVYTWNQALEHSVAKAREVECRRTGGSRSDCHAQFFEPGKTDMVSYGGWGIERVKEMDDVLVVCHNPVRSYDHEICGEVGYSARVGDLRHNFLFYWPYASKAPWGGIANWNADPLTGRIIGASATTMGRSATYSAALTRDIIMVANGELDLEEVTDGVPAYIYQRSLRNGYTPKRFTKEEIEARIKSIDAKSAVDTLGVPPLPIQPGETWRSAILRDKANTQVLLGHTNTTSLEVEALAEQLRGSQAEAQLVDPTWIGMQPPEMNDTVMDMLSPLRGGDTFKYRQQRDLMELRTMARGICFTDPEVANIGNQDVQGVAEYFKQKYSDDKLKEMFPDEADRGASYWSRKRSELIYKDLWKETYKGIQLHEMGHALGMLHQFASSYDSTNYNPQYWQLRTQEGKAMASCNGNPREGDDVFDSDADTCMGPRYLDPETDDELGRKVVGRGADAHIEEPRPGINYFAHTSTMEYQNERFFETVGLGQFDLHTMNALYGRVLQTFDPDADDGMERTEQFRFVGRLYSQLIDENLVVNGNSLTTQHYTSAARDMKLYDAGRCRPATEEELEHAEWRIVHGKVCSPPPKDYATWDDFTDDPLWYEGSEPTDQRIGLQAPRAQVKPHRPGAGNYRWPYRWGVSTNAYPHANSTDAGADIYELTVETIRKFDYSYIFNYFRRARRDWFYGGIPARTAGAFFERLRGYHWSIAITNSFLRGQGEETFVKAAEDDDDWRPYLMAETEMFNAIARALVMPQIGAYRKAENFQQSDPTRDLFDPDGLEYDDETGEAFLGEDAEFSVDASTGRFIDPAFYSGPTGGGSWDYQNWMGWIGFGSEKVDALRTLVDGRSVFFFVSRSNYLDGRNMNINFRADMGRAVDRLLGGLLSRDWESIAPYVERGVRTPEVQIMDLNSETPSRPPPEEAHLLFPNVSYRQQLGALVWGHLFSRLNTDLSLSNKLRIYVDGFQSQLNIPEEQQIRFYNPDSGFTYIARRYGKEVIDGREVDKGIASRMLERANLLLADAYEVELDENGEPLLDDYLTPILKVGEDGHAILKTEYEETAINTLRNYVGLLDMAVQINDMVGYGPVPE